jgi:hypothetical protein
VGVDTAGTLVVAAAISAAGFSWPAYRAHPRPLLYGLTARHHPGDPGLAIVITQVISDQFGRSAHFVGSHLRRPLQPRRSLFALSPVHCRVAVTLGIALALVTRFTHIGTIARAVILNPELAGRSASTPAG